MPDGDEEGECPSQRADPSAQNTTGGLAPMLNRSEVINFTELGKHSSSTTRRGNRTNIDNVIGNESSNNNDLDKGHLRSPLLSSSSSVVRDARCSARPTATESPILSPSSGNIQAGDAVPLGEPLFMADTGVSSGDQSPQKAGTHAIQDSIVELRQLQRSEPASNQGKRPQSKNAFTVPNSCKANIHRSEA
jgi:hypothetical protein